jgi:hypothetical protein
MSESEAVAWVALGWCYFWGAIVSFVLVYMLRAPDPTINRWIVLVTFSWPVTMPWMIVDALANMVKDKK